MSEQRIKYMLDSLTEMMKFSVMKFRMHCHMMDTSVQIIDSDPMPATAFCSGNSSQIREALTVHAKTKNGFVKSCFRYDIMILIEEKGVNLLDERFRLWNSMEPATPEQFAPTHNPGKEEETMEY